MNQVSTAGGHGHSTNLIGLPTGLLGSAEFNDLPRPLHISGVREMNRRLFQMLGQAEGRGEAAEAFSKYMTAMFGIDPEQRTLIPEPDGGIPKPYRASFIRLLLGWGYDSNAPEGAVLKGWVESRFGLVPTFHKQPIRDTDSPAWDVYVDEKMASQFHTNSIWSQLDILYEYCQWAITSGTAPLGEHLTLYRGVNSFEEHQIVERLDRRTVVMRFNNLGSFSSDREVADCFGETILTVRVPTVKVLFFNALLPLYPLKGEAEYLVIGGDYRVIAEKY